MTFAIGLAAALALAVLSLLGYLRKDFDFWPPPRPSSWQHRAFRLLFRIFFAALVVLSFTEFSFGKHPWRYLVGGGLFLTGFGLSLYWTRFLGWRNAFGEARGLISEGPFAWSRNPIYVASIIGMVGWALIVNSSYLTVLLCLWAVAYLGAPLLEEPWLEKEYGEAFRKYRATVPRFIGFRRSA